MTKTAKRDTSQAPAARKEPAPKQPAPEPAPTGSAAKDSAAKDTSAKDTSAKDTAAKDTAPAADAGHDSTGDSGPAAEPAGTPDLDETKRKFREALERKNQAHSDGQGKGGRDTSKIGGAHGPAASRRSFRRKSG